MLLEMLRRKSGEGAIRVDVKPGARKTELLAYLPETGTFKVSLKARPEHGMANRELVVFLSKLLGKRVRIISGLAKRKKTVRIE